MSKEKKAFKDTLFGKIIGKAGNVLPDVAGVVIKAATGDPMGAVNDVINHLSGNKTNESKVILDEILLKKAEIELEFSKIELQETQAYLADMQSARSREVELAKTGKSDWFMYVVGFLILLTFAAVVYVALFVQVKDEKLFYFIAGHVFGMAVSVVSYYFGSSKGSSDKTKLMQK